MRSSCPQPEQDTENSQEPVKYKCGICKKDDHDVTSKECPVKRKANEAARRQNTRDRKSRQQDASDGGVATSNRYAVLTPTDEETFPPLSLETEPEDTLTYKEALKRGKTRRNRKEHLHEPAMQASGELAEVEKRLSTLQEEVRRLRQRRTLLTRLSERSATADNRSFAAATPASLAPPPSAKLSPMELLNFVAQQLQHLSSVLLAHLPSMQ